MVHVSLTVPPATGAWEVWQSTFVHFINLTVTDDGGDVPTRPLPFGFAVTRPRKGALHVKYDVAAASTPTADPREPVVLDDRFRGAGDRLILLPPPSAREATMPMAVELDIDGSAITAPVAASTLGVGRSRRGTIAPHALQSIELLAGSLGTALFDAEAHDEAAWLGYTAFDPRGVTAEMAEIRGALGELFGGSSREAAWTTLFLAQAQPLGSFTTLGRAGGLFVQLGPTEPWSAPLRLSITQSMVRAWIGGELSFTDSSPEKTDWLEGVAWFEAMRALSRLGRLTPDEVRLAVSGEMSIALTSPYRGKSNDEVAAKATTDGAARAMLKARGALYALRVNSLLRAKKPASSLDTVLRELLELVRAQGERSEGGGRSGIHLDDWTHALTTALGDGGKEATVFRARIDQGTDPSFVSNAPLGPCFRVTRGEYVAFDLGFDEAATLVATPHAVTGLEAGGPAAKAGVQGGDAIESFEAKGGELASKIALVVRRDGKELSITYAPEGARQKGPALTRIRTLRDEQCGDVL